MLKDMYTDKVTSREVISITVLSIVHDGMPDWLIVSHNISRCP